MSDVLTVGVYVCIGCAKTYLVNEGTWRLCTPELCHDCLAKAAAKVNTQIGNERAQNGHVEVKE